MNVFSSKQPKAVVLDASAIINLRNLPNLSPQNLNIIPESIITEIKDFASRMRLETLLSSNLLKSYSVDYRYKKIVITHLKKFGSTKRLSSQDIDVLALAYQVKEENKNIKDVIIFTDDYEIQNSGSQLNFLFRPVTQQGIKNKVRWKILCSSCGKETEQETTCSRCGNKDFVYRVKSK